MKAVLNIISNKKFQNLINHEFNAINNPFKKILLVLNSKRIFKAKHIRYFFNYFIIFLPFTLI